MSHELIRALAHSSEDHEEPVFIVGNPRSGTSLLEQILSMHPEVENAGELAASSKIIHQCPVTIDSFNTYPNCLVDMREEDANAMARKYMNATSWIDSNPRRITNKSLSLHNQAGFLSLILPKSRMIMLHRHPLDNCISCYTTNLVGSKHNYTKQLDWLAAMWIERHKMQEYWMQTLEVPMLELHYDRMVVDQENETRPASRLPGSPVGGRMHGVPQVPSESPPRSAMTRSTRRCTPLHPDGGRTTRSTSARSSTHSASTSSRRRDPAEHRALSHAVGRLNPPI